MFNNHPCESEGIARGIGTCRAVWVPGQDLTTPHLIRNCGKCILSLHCTLYVSLCTHMLYAGDHMSSRPALVVRFEITWACRHLCRTRLGYCKPEIPGYSCKLTCHKCSTRLVLLVITTYTHKVVCTVHVQQFTVT